MELIGGPFSWISFYSLAESDLKASKINLHFILVSKFFDVSSDAKNV